MSDGLQLKTDLKQLTSADASALADGFHSTYLRFAPASYGSTLDFSFKPAKKIVGLFFLSGTDSFQRLTGAEIEFSRDGEAYYRAGRIIDGEVYLDGVFKQVRHMRLRLVRNHLSGLLILELQVLEK